MFLLRKITHQCCEREIKQPFQFSLKELDFYEKRTLELFAVHSGALSPIQFISIFKGPAFGLFHYSGH